MQKVQIGFGVENVLLIPASWDRFLYRGFLYRRDDTGRWVVDRGWVKKSA